MNRRLELALKECVTRMLAEKRLSKPDGLGGIFGQYVFADQRPDTPDEPNTPAEDDLADAFIKHFHGRPDKMQGWIDKLVAQRAAYPGFLSPPSRAKKAFRTLTVPEQILENIIGEKVSDEHFDGEVHIVTGGMMPGNFKGKTFFSWTLEPDIFYGLKKDWGSLFHTDWVKRSVGGRGFVVFVSANITDNDFVVNPDKMKKTGLAGKFSYQAEVLSVGEVHLSEIAFFYYDEDTTPEHESQLIRQAINLIR